MVNRNEKWAYAKLNLNHSKNDDKHYYPSTSQVGLHSRGFSKIAQANLRSFNFP